jgi:hypothetical protein
MNSSNTYFGVSNKGPSNNTNDAASDIFNVHRNQTNRIKKEAFDLLGINVDRKVGPPSLIE